VLPGACEPAATPIPRVPCDPLGKCPSQNLQELHEENARIVLRRCADSIPPGKRNGAVRWADSATGENTGSQSFFSQTPLFLEELAEDAGTRLGQYAGHDLGAVIQPRIVQKPV